MFAHMMFAQYSFQIHILEAWEPFKFPGSRRRRFPRCRRKCPQRDCGKLFSSMHYTRREYRPTTWAFLLGPAGGNSLLFLSPKATHKNLTYYLEYFIRMKWEFNQATKSKNVWNNQFKKLKFYAGQINWNVMQDNTLLIEKLTGLSLSFLPDFQFFIKYMFLWHVHVPWEGSWLSSLC